MNIILFTHPDFLGSQSMPRYASLLKAGMIAKGENVEVWTAKGRFVKLPSPQNFKKWLGYIDQYILFPLEVKIRLKKQSADTLFVFTDHALGPWVPLVSQRRHIIHCHDFLAQRSALGEISENPTGWTGRLYQKYIRSGYRKGQNFISVSAKTRDELHHFLVEKPLISEVVHNAINPRFKPLDTHESRIKLGNFVSLNLERGYLLHVGGNQWYKNREGVILLYDAWRQISNLSLPLLLIGQKPSHSLLELHQKSIFRDDIYMLENISDEHVHTAYAGATLFLFPSLAEGFGWPIAEAMASGCLVATTGEAPMTEVAGDAALLLARMPNENKDIWAKAEAKKIDGLLVASEKNQATVRDKGLKNVLRFNPNDLLDRLHTIYQSV